MKRYFPRSAITRNDVAALRSSDSVYFCHPVIANQNSFLLSVNLEGCDFTSFGNTGGKSCIMSHICIVEVLRIDMKRD